MNATERQDALRRCAALAGADDAALQELAEAANIETFAPGDVVFSQGEAASRVYVVAAGALEARLNEAAEMVSYFEPGALFGEYAMFANRVRTARVMAVQPTVLVSVDEQRFRAFLLRCPAVTLQLLQTAVRRLHRAERQHG